MNPYITTALIAIIIYGIIGIILTPMIVMGANAQQIAKGHATRSRDEIRLTIKFVRLGIALLILACVIPLAFMIL